jgi:Bacterial Ig-like domain
MGMQTIRYLPALLLIGCAAGCAGNGKGLDANGQSVAAGSSSGGPITATFQSIQENVFTPICSKCHIGASAPEGLQLDAAHSYNLLVGVPSNEQPNLLRVKPGDPNSSYLVHKIQGLPGIDGGQMPLGESPLPAATIVAIAQWITDGAPNSTTSAAAQVFALQASAPADKAIVKPPARIVVTFTQEVDASLVNDTTVALEMIDGSADAPPAAVSATRSLAPSNRAVLLITPNSGLAPGVYRVSLRGSGAAALANNDAVTLGTNSSFEFTVESAP